MKLEAATACEMERYVAAWFVDLATLARRCGVEEGVVSDLIDAGAAPGVIYAKSPAGEWWSALGAYLGRLDPAPHPGLSYYSPASVWHLRRALLHKSAGMTMPEAALRVKDKFLQEFVLLLPETEGAELAYAACFEGGRFTPEQAQTAAAQEWDAWVRGAYGVCMKRFSASACIEKEALRAMIVAARDPENPYRLGDERLFDCVEKLEALIMPFAPWERPAGSPGRAIDEPLMALKLGREEPYL